MARISKSIKDFLSKRGGNWSNWLRRINFYALPIALPLQLLRDSVVAYHTEQNSFQTFMIFCLSLIAGLWLLSQTAASNASASDGDQRTHYTTISTSSFAAGIYILPLSMFAFMVKSSWMMPWSWLSMLVTLIQVPLAMGALLNLLDLLDCLYSIRDSLLMLKLFNSKS